jgi:DNA-directed RNA polymerase subunit RPC12/RpoP
MRCVRCDKKMDLWHTIDEKCNEVHYYRCPKCKKRIVAGKPFFMGPNEYK